MDIIFSPSTHPPDCRTFFGALFLATIKLFNRNLLKLPKKSRALDGNNASNNNNNTSNNNNNKLEKLSFRIVVVGFGAFSSSVFYALPLGSGFIFQMK